MAQKIEIIRGTTDIYEITVLDAALLPYELKNGEKIIFGVKKNAEDTNLLLVREATSGAVPGVYIVTLVPEDTADLDCGKYVYDVGLQSGSNYFNIIEPDLFKIVANVTKRGCAD